MGGKCLNAFKKQVPRLVGKGKVNEPFAVQSRVPPDDLYANCTHKLAVGCLGDQKFSRPFSQLAGGQKHGRPQRLEALKVIRCRSTDFEL